MSARPAAKPTLAQINALCQCAASAYTMDPFQGPMRSLSAKGARRLADAYIALAKKNSAPPELWFFSRPYHRDEYEALHNLVFELTTEAPSQWREAAESLINAGANPWLDTALRFGRSPGQIDFSFRSGQSVGHAVFSRSERVGMRSLLFKSALSSLALSPPNALCEMLDEYAKAVKPSRKSAKGVMGSADKLAKSACQTLLSRKEELLAATKTPKETRAALAAIGDATERLAAKTDKTAEIDPVKLKKDIAPERKRRMSALLDLTQKYPDQTDLIASAFEATAWLKQTPHLASLPLHRSTSLVQAALETGCSAALEALEAMGANIWLAAAQAGESNACRWAIERLSGPPGNEASVARMLLRGAWLEGSASPKERCLELCRQIVARGKGSTARAQIASAFLSAMERQSLDEIIAPSSAPAKSDPAKKRASL